MQAAATFRSVMSAGNRAVVITSNPSVSDVVRANVYVNARHGIDQADITNIRWTGRSHAGAIRWATKQLAAA